MAHLKVLWNGRSAEFRNRIRTLIEKSRFKLFVLLFASLLFWFSLYAFFRASLGYFRDGIGERYFQSLVESILYLFFGSLFAMLTISNGILAYSSLFRSREMAFLLSGPVRLDWLYLFRIAETATFSSWAFLFLAGPLVLALGHTTSAPFPFYLASGLFSLLFLMVAAGLGCLGSMFLVNFAPRVSSAFPWLLGSGVAMTALILRDRYLELRDAHPGRVEFVMELMREVAFTRNPLLPSYWAGRGILNELDGGGGESTLLFLGLLATTGLLLCVLGFVLAPWMLPRGWDRAEGSPATTRRRRPNSFRPGLLLRCLPLSGPVRVMIQKDLRTFVRDPAQWIQFMIFFGLLGLYFLNLRNFGYEEEDPFWRSVVGQINVSATALTLSTFASRFIFPQFSLEGRRYWIVGMVPIKKEAILYGKLTVSFLSLAGIGQMLGLISGFMLRLPLLFIAFHMVLLAGVALGLSGMSVGLGAVFPNFRESSPARIVSGFGGTLNLVLNLMFVTLCVLAASVPFFPMVPGFSNAPLGVWFGVSLGVVVAVSLVACLVPMRMAIRAVRDAEI